MERKQSCCGYTWSLKVLFFISISFARETRKFWTKENVFPFFFLLSLKTLFQVLRAKCKESGIGPSVCSVIVCQKKTSRERYKIDTRNKIYYVAFKCDKDEATKLVKIRGRDYKPHT